MSDTIKTVLDIGCPQCGLHPLHKPGAPGAGGGALEDFIGRQCVHCGYTLTMDDLHRTLRDGMDKLSGERAGPEAESEFP
ncbi:hypothetical protein HAQ04_22905 [Pseudomonas sp. C2L11]|nr:hypothetical protein [Pseudomonas typographi]